MIKKLLNDLIYKDLITDVRKSLSQIADSIYTLKSAFYDLEHRILHPPPKKHWVHIVLLGQHTWSEKDIQTAIHSDGMWLESEQAAILYISPDVAFNKNSLLMVFGPANITSVNASNQSLAHSCKIKFCPIPVELKPGNRLSCSVECI